MLETFSNFIIIFPSENKPYLYSKSIFNNMSVTISSLIRKLSPTRDTEPARGRHSRITKKKMEIGNRMSSNFLSKITHHGTGMKFAVGNFPVEVLYRARRPLRTAGR